MESEILDYIRRLRKEGFEIDEIRQALLNAGHDKESADRHISYMMDEEKMASKKEPGKGQKTITGEEPKKEEKTAGKNESKSKDYKFVVISVAILVLLLFAVIFIKGPHEKYSGDSEEYDEGMENDKQNDAAPSATKKTGAAPPPTREQEEKLNKSKEIINENKGTFESSSNSVKEYLPKDVIYTFSARMQGISANVDMFLKQPTLQRKESLLNDIANFRQDLKQQFPKIEQSKETQQKFAELLNALTYLETSILETKLE